MKNKTEIEMYAVNRNLTGTVPNTNGLQDGNTNQSDAVWIDQNPKVEVPQTSGSGSIGEGTIPFQPGPQPIQPYDQTINQDRNQSMNSDMGEESMGAGMGTEECGWNFRTLKIVLLCVGVVFVVSVCWFAYGAQQQRDNPETQAITTRPKGSTINQIYKTFTNSSFFF